MIKELVWNKISFKNSTNTSPLLEEYRVCPICSSMRYKNIFSINNFQFYSDSDIEPKQFNVHQNMCLNCYGLFMNPTYSKLGFNILFKEASKSYGAKIANVEAQIDWLKNNNVLKNSVLDIGCFEGDFLAALPGELIKYGVDIDEGGIKRGNDKYNGQDIKLFLSDFNDFVLDDSPDLITMFHILEHLPNPLDVLKNLD